MALKSRRRRPRCVPDGHGKRVRRHHARGARGGQQLGGHGGRGRPADLRAPDPAEHHPRLRRAGRGDHGRPARRRLLHRHQPAHRGGQQPVRGRRLHHSRRTAADRLAAELQGRRRDQPRHAQDRLALPGGRLPLDHMAISPDGRVVVVSASTGNVVHALDTRTGKEVGRFPSGDSPHENNYSADGSRIFHASIGLVYTPPTSPPSTQRRASATSRWSTAATSASSSAW